MNLFLLILFFIFPIIIFSDPIIFNVDHTNITKIVITKTEVPGNPLDPKFKNQIHIACDLHFPTEPGHIRKEFYRPVDETAVVVNYGNRIPLRSASVFPDTHEKSIDTFEFKQLKNILKIDYKYLEVKKLDGAAMRVGGNICSLSKLSQFDFSIHGQTAEDINATLHDKSETCCTIS